MSETLLTVGGQPTYTGVSLHSSAYNLPIPIFWGKRRLTPNVIWWSTFGSASADGNNNIGPFRGVVGFKPGSAVLTAVGGQGGEVHTVPALTPWQITAIQPFYNANISVAYDGTNIILQQVSPGSEALGKYSVTGNVYTFSHLDASAVVALWYTTTDSGKVTWGDKTTWWIPAIFALCEGPVDAVYRAWDGQTGSGTYQTILASNATGVGFGLQFFNGSSSQAVWPEWAYRNSLSPTNQFLAESLIPYRGTAFLAAWNNDSGTGQTGELPQQSFECSRQPGGATYASPEGDYSLAYCLQDLLENVQYGLGLASIDIDGTTFGQYFSYGVNQGLYFSPLLDGQTKAIDIIDRWALVSNTWIYWDGTKIRFAVLADKAVGSFTPDLAASYALGISDYLDAAKPVEVERIDPVDCYNRVTVQICDRALSYSPNPIEYKDQGLIDQYGVLDASSVDGNDICDAYVGAIVASLIGQRYSYVRNVYSFTLSWKYILLLPGSIVTLTEPNIGLNAQPVRIRSVEEDDKGQLRIVAEELPGTTGIATPMGAISGVSQGSGSVVNKNVSPGNINTPVIVEPSSALVPQPSVLLAASGGVTWGGCVVYFSADNVNYTAIGSLVSRAPQALLTATLASHADPDTTNTLAVDFTESFVLIPTSTTHADADASRTLSVIATPPTGTDPLVMPNVWEFISYGTAANTGGFADNLTYLRRGLFGSVPSSHAIGDDFTELTNQIGNFTSGTTVPCVLWPIPAQYIGATIYFKFLSYNLYGPGFGAQQLSGVPAYQYTPTGAGFGGGTAGVPLVPTGLAATGGPGQILVTWNPNAGTDNVTSYTLYAAPGLSSSFGSAVQIYSGLGTTFDYSGLGNSAPYTFFLLATNAVGPSAHTSGVNATTLGNGAGSTNEVVFQPSGTAGGNVYTTWATLFAAAIAINGPVTIFFDSTGQGSIPSYSIPSGTYSFPNKWVAFVSSGPPAGSNGLPVVSLQTGVSITAQSFLVSGVSLDNASASTTPFNYSSGLSSIVMGSELGALGAWLNNSGGAPLVKISGGTTGIYMRGQSRIQGTSVVDVTTASGGTRLAINAFDFAYVPSPSLASANPSNVLVNIYDPSVLIDTTGGWTVVIDPLASQVSYSPATPGNWSPAPTLVNTALDQLAARALPALGTAGQFVVVNAGATAPTYVSISGDIDNSTTTPGKLYVNAISGTNGGGGNIPLNIASFTWSSTGTIIGGTTIKGNFAVEDAGANALWQLTELPTTTIPAIYAGGVTPSASNYALAASGSATIVNGPTVVDLSVAGNPVLQAFAANIQTSSSAGSMWELAMIPTTTIPALYAQGASPGAGNYTLYGSTSTTALNVAASGTLYLGVNDTAILSIGSAGLDLAPTTVAMTTANVTLSAAQYLNPVIAVTGTIGAAGVQLVFPDVEGRWELDVSGANITGTNSIVVKNTFGSFTIGVATGHNLFEIRCTASTFAYTA